MFTLPKLFRIIGSIVLTGLAIICKAQTPQTLKLTDFAIWGGSASANSYNSSQGIFFENNVIIEGNMGTNHLIDVKNSFTLTGDVYTGNRVIFKNNVTITGSIYAAKKATNLSGEVITIVNNGTFKGDLVANGKITLKNNNKITGQVRVPAPTSTNYAGPVPSAGVVNTVAIPELPAMPGNTPFDSEAGTINITATQTITPGVYKKLALNGNKTLTFDGPGNYIFDEVDNGSTANKLVFDFKNTSAGIINILIIKDSRWGAISVSTKNGDFPTRINTEVHGNGASNSGNSFELRGGSLAAGNYSWLGTIWAPNGGINLVNTSIPGNGSPNIIGALWSGKAVTVKNNLKLVYNAPVADPNYIEPYYPPPVNGKVSSADNTIGAELSSLSQNPNPISSIPENEIFILDEDGKVMIEVISKEANNTVLRDQLVALGMTELIDNGPHVYIISGFFPINKLSQLNGNPAIEYVRPLYPPISNSGLVTTMGDITMRSNTVRSRFGLQGSGVKIGVISDSYDAKLGAQTDVDEGDLPGIKSSGDLNDNPEPVQVLEDLAGRGNDEGRAMLQIVHDVAPKSKLAFHTGFLSAGHFARAIQKMASPDLPGGRCDIIVDDLTYITEPFQRDGIVAQAVNQVVAQGVTYFSSAGNFGNKSYEAVFNGVTNTAVMPTGQIHRFGPNNGDIYQTINLKPGSYTIGLQWSDEFSSMGSATGVQTDMDLYLIGANGYKLFGFNRSNLFGDPFEVCAFTVKEETNARLMIVRAAGTSNVRFKYIIFRGEGTIMDFQSGTSSIVGHPNAEGTISVGAMLYADIPPFTPVWPGVASFSSRGGTFTRQGSGSSFTQRNHPVLVGPNGVNTTVNLGGAQFNDGDTYPNFFGTSAAAPHVAAVGALLIEGRKKFNLQNTVTPNEIRQQLVSSAGKFTYLPGSFSFEGGYGYVQADSAVAQIANARPVISTLEAVVAGSQNGTAPFEVRITGKYLTGTTQIYVDNTPVNTTVTFNAATGVGTATAIVPDIAEDTDPAFQLFNPAKSPSGLDGGFSEALHFFSAGIRVKVKADNKSRKYGQENPALTASVTIINGLDTLDISQTSLTLADLKLEDLVFATNATTFSSPRSYGISVAKATPLPPNDPLREQYIFEFEPGTLTVERMTLRITPKDMTVKYGDDLSGVDYYYEIDQAGVNAPHLLDEIKSLHKKFLAQNGLVVINGFKEAAPQVTSADLTNMGMMASFQSVRNARKFTVENGQLKALTGTLPASQIGEQRFIVDVSAQSLFNYRNNPSQSSMVNATQTANARAFLNIKSLTGGNAKASVSNGEVYPMVNGQLIAMVNGQLQALVNSQTQALINNELVFVQDMTFQNGQLLALLNGAWLVVTNGILHVMVNDQAATIELSVANGQLQAMVNGEMMQLVNGQLQAIVNGQLVAMVNAQLKAMVNTQLTPMVNGQLMAIVNGQLQPLSNGQLVAIVNGQLMAMVNGELEAVQDVTLANGQLLALVNGQLLALVNGQLKAMVNGVVTDIPTTDFTLVNGQLQAMVNGQLLAMVNGQLMALVNGQLQALVNGSAVAVESVTQLANGQLKAMVNGVYIPISNGQLQALVNGQLLAMVNGQLMAMVNGELTFVVFQNGQLQALVNGQLLALVNAQLKAMVNGQLQEVNSYTIANAQLKAMVNGEEWIFPNGQLKAIVNGQLQALVNNFDVSGANNNANTAVVVDEDDINLQAGDVGGMFSMNMISGLEAGYQVMLPGAFVNENYEVTYGAATIFITKKPLYVSADNKTKAAGDANPPLTVSYSGFAFDDTPSSLCSTAPLPPPTTVIDQVERRTTYTDVLINGVSNVYYADPGETLTVTGNWSEVYYSDIFPDFVPYCPGCITQQYIGIANGDYNANVFDTCFDVSGLTPYMGSINNTFIAPTRPGIYYITQNNSWWFSCYQFGHMLHDQSARDAIAVVIVEPSAGISANTSAFVSSPEGEYPIVVGGCYFNPNYRIVFQDGTLTVGPGIVLDSKSAMTASAGVKPKETRLYPNPASTFIRLQLENDVRSVSDLQVFDVVGKTSPAKARRIDDGMYEIDISGLGKGIYFIKARTTAGIRTFRFVKI